MAAMTVVEIIAVMLLSLPSVQPVSTRILRTIDLSKDADWCGAECANGAKVAFIGGRTIAISFRGPDKDASGHATDRKVFRGTFYDVGTGDVKGKLQWACCANDITDVPQLLAVHNEGFLVRPQGGNVIRYSSDLKVQVEIRFPGPPGTYWDVQITPGGQIAFLVSGPGPRDQFSQTWLDVDTLKVISARKGLYNLHDPAAEDAVAVLDWAKTAPFRRFITLEEKEGIQRILAYDHVPGPFIANDCLLAFDKGGFSVIKRNGETLFTGELTYAGRPTLWSERSLDGNRFAILDFSRAIPVIEKRGFFDWNFTAKAYDMKFRKQIVEFKVGTQDARTVSLALSPDGSQLAILAGSKCDIVELPVQ